MTEKLEARDEKEHGEPYEVVPVDKVKEEEEKEKQKAVEPTTPHTGCSARSVCMAMGVVLVAMMGNESTREGEEDVDGGMR